MKNIRIFEHIALGIMFLATIIVIGCDGVSNPVQDVFMTHIERSHIYESDQLMIPEHMGTVDMMERFADESGNPEIVILTAQGGTLIQREPEWFSKGEKIKRFYLAVANVNDIKSGLVYDFYWTSPEYTLGEHVEEFKKIPAPGIHGFAINEYTDGIDIYFERSDESRRTLGLKHRTSVNDATYTQWATWSSKGNMKSVWSIYFGKYVPGGSSEITIAAVLMTEIGDYEISSNTLSIPYEVGEPYNVIE